VQLGRKKGRKTGRKALVMCAALALTAIIDSRSLLRTSHSSLHFQNLTTIQHPSIFEYLVAIETSAFPRALVRINQTRNDPASNGEPTNWKHDSTNFDCRRQSFVLVGPLDKQIERQHVVSFFFISQLICLKKFQPPFP
jgi:hypothetical protein